MIAIIDIGSNTIRLNVYLVNHKEFRLAFSSKEMAGLVSFIENGNLSADGINNLIRILNIFNKTLSSLSITDVYPFATASLRNINNTSEVLTKVHAATGLSIDLISGKQEGILGFKGATELIDIDNGLLVDIGGGSTEIVPFEHKEVTSSKSLRMGSLSYFREYVSEILPNLDEVSKMKRASKHLVKVNREFEHYTCKTLVGVGGTIRALLKLNQYIFNDYSPNLKVSYKRFKEILDIITSQSQNAKTIILRIIPDRIHTIVPGLLILNSVMKTYDCKEILVSNYGAREGYLLSHVLID